MKPGDAIESMLIAYPPLARWLIGMSFHGRLPRQFSEYWRIARQIPTLFPDGLLGTINGEAFYVPGAAALFYRDFEPLTCQVLEASVGPDTTFVDVGANIGYYSIVAARRGATVHAFEPGRLSLALLRKNIELHDARRITVHPIALGADVRRLPLNVTPETYKDSISPLSVPSSLPPIMVDQRRLDDVIAQPVDLIKIDIQGTELDALAGMAKTLATNDRVKVMVEWEPQCMRRAGFRPADLPTFLRDHGLTEIDVLDDAHQTRRSVEEMASIMATNPRTTCNLLARKP